ncbi:MAG: helix-turn-helix transcriptional regulator [Clostridia bacterium]|nr:helix-turn-helix transcriptional regulator [Clostridia bacterium]
MNHYQKILYELRIDGDYKQEDIAKVLQITKQAYGHYENGKRQLPIEHLIKLCEFYNVSADYLLGLREGLPYPKR